MESERKAKDNGVRRVTLLAIRRQAIAELDSGFFRVSDIALKYGVGESTVWNWRNQVANAEQGPDPAEAGLDMEQVANEILQGVLTVAGAMERYGLTRRYRVLYWKNRVRKENWKRGGKVERLVSDLAAMQKSNGRDPVPGDDVALLLAELSAAKLRVASLEALIDVAEQEMGMDIRKKHGSKQSRG